MVFKCKNCGGQVVYNPIKKAMVCTSCDSIDSADIIESKTPRVCSSCGAQIEVKKYTSATKCSSCGNFVILDSMISYPYGPDLVLPFLIDKEKATEILRSKFKKSLFIPGNFLTDKTLEYLSGEYVPFWLYGINSHIEYNAIGVKVRSWTTGNTEYTETSKYSVHRKLRVDFNRIPVDASEEMDDKVMDLMEPYDYNELTGFKPDYLSGFNSEAYNYTPDELFPRAQKKAGESSSEWLKSTIKQYTRMESPQEKIKLNRVKNEFALMPVWKYTYRYGGKNYDFYVNGQNGKTYGSIPICMPKLIGYSGLVFGVVACFLTALELLMEVL